MNVTLRRFAAQDVPLKVRWINDPLNHAFLHYDLPLEETATMAWFHRIQDVRTRLDLTILCDDVPVGIAGLLHIDDKNRSAELYITVGENAYRGKGVAGKAMEALLKIGFGELRLHRIYLMTETANLAAVRAYEKFGFIREGCLRDEIMNTSGQYVSRYVYAMLKEEFEERYGTTARISHSVFGEKS